MSSTDKQGSSLDSFPLSPPLYPHLNRPSGFWPCVKSCLVGDSDKYRLLLKSLFNSVLPHLLFFFCRYQTSSFYITLSHRALQLVYIGKVHLPLLGDDGGVVIVGLLILITSVCLVWHRSGRRAPLLEPVWKPVLNCQNFATWFSYIAIWWINSKVPEGSMITSETVVQHVKVHAWLY